MKKKIWLAAAAVLLAAIVAAVICVKKYVLVEFTFYPRNAVSLDLRGKEISLEHYEKLHKKLPDAAIRWDVPFQGSTLADDTRELTLAELTPEEWDGN